MSLACFVKLSGQTLACQACTCHLSGQIAMEISRRVAFAQQHDVKELALDISALAYPALVYAHLLLCPRAGADVGVFVLVSHFRSARNGPDQSQSPLLTFWLKSICARTPGLMVPFAGLVAAGGCGRPLADVGLGAGWPFWLGWCGFRMPMTQTPARARNPGIEGAARHLWLTCCSACKACCSKRRSSPIGLRRRRCCSA